MQDEFTELFELAKTSLTTKAQTYKKPTPFDEEYFATSNTNEVYRQKIGYTRAKPGVDCAAKLFGDVKPISTAEPQYGGIPIREMNAPNPIPTGYVSEIVNPPGMAESQEIPQGASTAGTIATEDIFDLF